MIGNGKWRSLTGWRGLTRFGIGVLIFGTLIFGTLVSGTLIAGSAFSAGDEPAALTPRGKPKIHGTEVKRTTDKLLSEVHWHRDLEHALAIAKEEGKPVFWLQLVGELDDGL